MKKKLGIVFFLLGLTFLLTACGTTEINMNDYVDITFNGYEYVGYPSSEVDIQKMMLDNEDSFGFDRKALKKSPGEDVLEDLEEALIIYFDSYNELKNGDKVGYNWLVDEDTLAEIEEEYKVTFLYEDADLTVSDLEPLTERNIFEYMDIEFDGRDGDGYMSYLYIDDYYIKDQLVISKSTGLSNGDVITLTIPDTLISDYRWQGYNLVPASIECTVSDLSVPEEVDAFSGVELYFYGSSPYITVDVETWYSDYNFYYEYDDSGYFANGDTITLTIPEYSIEEALDYYNIIPKETSKTFTISGQPVMIMSLNDADESAWTDLYSEYETSLADSISSGWENSDSLQSVTAIGHAVAVEDVSWAPDTYAFTFYEVAVDPMDSDPFSYYYYVQHENLQLESDGTLYSSYDSEPYGYSFWGSAYGDCFIVDDLYYIGFQTIDELLDATVYEYQNSGWTTDYILNTPSKDAEDETADDEVTEGDATAEVTDPTADFEFCYSFMRDGEYVDGYYMVDGYAYRDDGYGVTYGYFDENGEFQKMGYMSYNESEN